MKAEEFLREQEYKQIGVTSPDRLWLKRWFVEWLMEEFASQFALPGKEKIVEIIEKIGVSIKEWRNHPTYYNKEDAANEILASLPVDVDKNCIQIRDQEIELIVQKSRITKFEPKELVKK
jgi:hypothetical protein